MEPLLSPPPPGNPKKSAFAESPPILSSVPASDPGEAPKKEQPKSVTGFMENFLNDGWDLAKGLYEIIPSTVKSYQQNVPYILKNLDAVTPKMIGNAAVDTAKDVGKAIAEPYQKYGASVVYHKPVTFAGDLITVLTLGGGSLKNAGKIAMASGGYTATAKAAAKAAMVGLEAASTEERLAAAMKAVAAVQDKSKAFRLYEAGKFLEELPGQLARKGIDLSVEAATGGKVNLAKRREFLFKKGTEQGRMLQKIQGDVEGVVSKIDALTPEEKELFHKARTLGDAPGVGVPDAALTPKVKEALDAYTELVNKVDPNMVDHGITEFYKSRSYLNAETAENTLAKKFALEAWDDVSPQKVAEARELIKKMRLEGKRAPVYGQNVFIDDAGKTLSADTLLDDMITGGKKMREGKINPLEAMKGAAGYTKDPSIYVREMIKNFRTTESKARLAERLLESPELIKARNAAAPGMKAESIPEGIHRKYYEDPIRAQALKNITDPTIQRLLKWEYTKNNSSLIKVYDRMHSLFARSATMYNPKWVTGNIVGDAVLGMLAGSDWMEGMRQLKAGNMPSQIAAKNATLSTREITMPAGRLKTAVNYLPEKAADVAGYVDQATRAGIITKEVGRRMKEVAVSFEGSAATFEDVLRSSDRFSDVQVQMRLLEERAARRSLDVRTRDRQIAALQQREAALSAKLEASEVQKNAKRQQKISPLSEQASSMEAEGQRIWPADYKHSEQAQKVEALRTKAEALKQKAILGNTGEPGFEKGMRKLEDTRQRIVNLTKERDLIVRDITDDLAKSGELEKLVPGLRQQVDILRPAVERANAFVGDYLALDGFEQGVMRRIIPFFPWAKAMSMLAFRLPFIAPVKSFAWNRFSDALSTLTNDPSLPDDFKGRVPVAVTKDGKTVWVKLTTYSPFESLKTSQVAGVPVPGMFNIAERNPFIGLAFKFFGGKTIWDASSIPYGEQMVSIGDGTVLRVRPDGKIEREIPQTPLVSGVMHMFPSVQLVEQVLSPFWTNKYNWAGMPEPVLNADGSYKYPRELWDRIGAAIGLNVMSRDTAEVVRSRKLKAIKNVREMQKQYKRTQDPEEREFILEATKDYIKQEVRGGK